MYASVCSVLLAASAAAPALAGAPEGTPENPSANALAVKAVATLTNGDAKAAVLLFNEAIESRKLDAATLANALVNRALARQKLGHHHKAILDYSAALKIDAMGAQRRAVALYNRGLSWRELGKPARAIEDFTAALFYDPRFARGYYSRANILHASGQYLFALADYDKALKYGYERPYQAHYAKAMILDVLGRKGDARDALYAALKSEPGYSPARRKLAALLKDGGDKGVSFAALAPARGTGRASGKRPSTLVTASISRSGGADLNLRKREVPAAVAPPVALGNDQPRERQEKKMPAPAGGMMLAKAEKAEKAEKTPGKAAGKSAGTATRNKVLASAGDEKPKKAAVKSESARLAVIPANAPAPGKRIVAGNRHEDKGEAATEPKVTYSGWAIQISSQRSEDGAWKHWKKLQGKVKRVVRGPKPVVMKAELPGRGTYYRLRLVGFGDNRKLANRLCKRLKRRGTSCLVTRAGS